MEQIIIVAKDLIFRHRDTERLAIPRQRLFSWRGFVFFLIATLIIGLGSPAKSSEARRCLREGKVVITNVPCEFFGNAAELNPVPEKHFKRGDPEPRSVVTPPSNQSEPFKRIPSPQASNQVPDSSIRQVLSTLSGNLLLPMLAVIALVVWFRRRTQAAAHHRRREPFAAKPSTQPERRESDPVTPYAKVEPLNPTGSISTSEQTKPAAWSLELIRDLEWKRFEDVCQRYYEHKGIRSETTPLGPDGGIDIRLYQNETSKPSAIVQCKAWGERIVGVKPIRELLGVMTHEKVEKAVFMTSSHYSEDAKAIADANRMTLIDGPTLLEMFQHLPPAQQVDLLDFATDGDYRTPTCPSCGIKMIRKTGSPGKQDFWGCPTYPRCHQTLPMRHK